MRRWLHVIGWILGLAGVAFVAQRLYSHAEQIDLTRFSITAWSVIIFLAFIYGSANLFLARAWWNLLTHFDIHAEWKWAAKAYGQSQLAKYVPGNIMHLAGRQALGMAVGLPAGALAKSAVWELGLFAIVGAFFGIFLFPLLWPDFSVWISFVLFSVMMLALFIVVSRVLSPSVTSAMILQMTFLVISGIVFIGTLALVVPTTSVLPAFLTLCGAYVIGWLAGLVTPGAPAGVGIREMVLLFLLGGTIAKADLLLAVVLSRVVTVLGDLFYFMTVSFLKQAKTRTA